MRIGKWFFLVFTAVLLCSKAWAWPVFKPGSLPLVDGVYNSTQAVVNGHQPLFSWEYACVVASFTITVSDDDIFSPAGELWNYHGSTSMANSINFITRVPYNVDGSASLPVLAGSTVYYWQVALYDDHASSAALSGQFTTVASEASLPGEKIDLAVDWNNPFDPSRGQCTKFRFTSKDHDRRMRVRVYTLSGELVREWPEQVVLTNAWYTETWDGKNANGEIVARGLYLVNLIDTGEGKGITRRVAVVK